MDTIWHKYQVIQDMKIFSQAQQLISEEMNGRISDSIHVSCYFSSIETSDSGVSEYKIIFFLLV